MPIRIFGVICRTKGRISEPVEVRGRHRLTLALAIALLAGLVAPAARSTDLPVRGGSGGGSFKSDCSGDYVVGVYLHSGAWIDAIGLKCASFDARQGKFRFPAWNKPYQGGTGGSPQEAICPSDDYYVSGMKVGFTRDGGDPKYADYVQLTCSPVGAGAAAKVCLHTGHGCWDNHPDPPPEVPFVTFLAAPVEDPCPPGEAAVGIHGRSGQFVDALGLICGPRPTKLTQPEGRKRLGKWREYAIAKNDVDIYAGPGGNFENTGIIMREGVKALSLRFHPDGWRMLQLDCGRPECWVAEDHLYIVSVPPGGVP